MWWEVLPAVVAADAWRSSVLAASEQECDVVVLFARVVEIPQRIENGGQRSLGGKLPILLQSFNQALFAEFFISAVARFGYSVGK